MVVETLCLDEFLRFRNAFAARVLCVSLQTQRNCATSLHLDTGTIT
jgi:hypothetical protein